jgi:hypothetical protein
MKKLAKILFAISMAVAISMIGSQELQALTEKEFEEQTKKWEEVEKAGETYQGQIEEEAIPEDEEEIKTPAGGQINDREDPEEGVIPLEDSDTPDSEEMLTPDMKGEE